MNKKQKAQKLQITTVRRLIRPAPRLYARSPPSSSAWFSTREIGHKRRRGEPANKTVAHDQIDSLA